MRMCWYLSSITTPMTLESTHIAMIKIKHPKSTIKSNTKMILVSRSQVSESLQLINCLIRVDGPWLHPGLELELSVEIFSSKSINRLAYGRYVASKWAQFWNDLIRSWREIAKIAIWRNRQNRQMAEFYQAYYIKVVEDRILGGKVVLQAWFDPPSPK